MQKMSDAPLKRCPGCRGKLEKIISQTSFQLKGSGWYVTDYARKSGEAKAAKSGKAEKSEAKTGEAKTSDGGSSAAKSKTDD
jgi:predicted nucleic acid-binding Zn ribbon protein